MTEREALQELVTCSEERVPEMMERWVQAWRDARRVLAEPADPVAAMWAKVDAAKAGDPVSAIQDQLAGRPRPAPADDLVRRLLRCPGIGNDPECYCAEAADRIEALQAELRDAYAAVDANWVQHQRVVAAEAKVAALEYKVELLRAELQLCRTVEAESGER